MLVNGTAVGLGGRWTDFQARILSILSAPWSQRRRKGVWSFNTEKQRGLNIALMVIHEGE